jgi:hypothetical protein
VRECFSSCLELFHSESGFEENATNSEQDSASDRLKRRNGGIVIITDEDDNLSFISMPPDDPIPDESYFLDQTAGSGVVVYVFDASFNLEHSVRIPYNLGYVANIFDKRNSRLPPIAGKI